MSTIEIFIIATIVVAILVVVFIILDRRKNKDKEELQEQVQQAKREKQQTKANKPKKNKKVAEPAFNEHGMTNYNTYQFSSHEFLLWAIVGCGILFTIGFVFYQNVILAALFSLVGLYFPKMRKKQIIQKRKAELSRQFQQALFSLSSSLIAGRSIENAFKEVTNDLYLLYPGKQTMIIQEFEHINKRLENREPIEKLLKEFSERAGIEDISNFTDVFVTCKRTGGDLVEVIRRTANMISEKFEIQQEISVMIAQKRFESNALVLIPIGIVALLTYFSGDYMEPLYKWSELGPIVMTFCLGLLALSFWICQRIMNIEV
ncbi:type II secretion system F family protein [Gracilibacillus sp. HCP3S3_G5_1]|uniref:type II secretion system F family protein n=1 Tax=unclassified Gracilibacillus TaxID=2625209 RepID=UPI003F8CA81D